MLIELIGKLIKICILCFFCSCFVHSFFVLFFYIRYDHVKPTNHPSTDKENQPTNKSNFSKIVTPSLHKPVPLSNHTGETFKSNMVSLKKGVKPVAPSEISASLCGKSDDEWVKAKEFVPGQPYQGAGDESFNLLLLLLLLLSGILMCTFRTSCYS